MDKYTKEIFIMYRLLYKYGFKKEDEGDYVYYTKGSETIIHRGYFFKYELEIILTCNDDH